MNEMKARLLEMGWSEELANALLAPSPSSLHFDSDHVDQFTPQYHDSSSLRVEITNPKVIFSR